MQDTLLSLQHITKNFGEGDVLRDISLDVARGEFVTLLGASGCGKTTTLRIISGLETPDEGTVLLDGKDVTALPPERRPVNTVFQSYALFPHMNVEKNISYGLRVRGAKKADWQKCVEEMLRLVQLEGYEKRMPSQLSGGQRQRVAIARMLTKKTPIMVFDDSLSAVDTETDEKIRSALDRDLGGATTIIISHRITTLLDCDNILVLEKGRVSQLGSPKELLAQPGIFRKIYDMQMSIGEEEGA